jgi:hypothetical protein
LILNTLQFNMSVPTPYVFMRRFLKAADYDKQVKNHSLICFTKLNFISTSSQ